MRIVDIIKNRKKILHFFLFLVTYNFLDIKEIQLLNLIFVYSSSYIRNLLLVTLNITLIFKQKL